MTKYETTLYILGITIMSLIVILICSFIYTNQRDNAYVESRKQFNESVMNNARENNWRIKARIKRTN